MEGGLVKDFIETMGYNDNIIEFQNKYYFFNGFDYNQNTKIYSFTVYEVADKGYGEIIGTQFYHESESAQECITKFLEAKIWDNKTFYEVEKDMKWLD